MRTFTPAEERRFAALKESRDRLSTEIRHAAWWCAKFADLGLVPVDVARTAAACLMTLARGVAFGRLDLRHASESARALLEWADKAKEGDAGTWTGGPPMRPRGR